MKYISIPFFLLFFVLFVPGAEMLYVAMFDEVNEETAIFKVTDHPPVSTQTSFAGLDGQPSDQYLWLTGEAAKRLRREKPLEPNMPVRN